jgi:alcohol dehydrogenase (NADP+)
MMNTKGYAAHGAAQDLVPYQFDRRMVSDDDVLIQILYCGICHADIHQSRNEYGGTVYPLVPGHEIVGRVTQAGPKVSKFKTGDLVGVGYFVNSCKHCDPCTEGEEQYCENGITATQNGRLGDGTTTKGGYSDFIVVGQDYVLKVSEHLILPVSRLCFVPGLPHFRHSGIGKLAKVIKWPCSVWAALAIWR